MSHNILSLGTHSFNVRVTLGGCMVNINGHTVDCEVEVDSRNRCNPTYIVTDMAGGQELCTFRPYHLHGGPLMYDIEGASDSNGYATLIVPQHGMLDREEEEDFDEDE
jgi:hypothetical protein